MRAYLSISILLLIASCKEFCPDGCRQSLKVTNFSNTDINVYYALNNSDTNLSVEKPFLASLANSESYNFYSNGLWEKIILGKLQLFILPKDSVDIYSWEYIRNNSIVLKRVELTADEIKINNYAYTYQK